MARHEEPISLGVFTAPNPSRLSAGQLSYLQNGIYLPGSQRLHRARGRASFGAVTSVATDVDGLRDLQFDNGDQYLVSMISGTASGNGFYRSAPMGDAGTFSTLASAFTAGAQLEVVHYRNRFFLMNGTVTNASAIGSNLVTYLSATAAGTTISTRQHGMLPVRDTPATATGAGSFSQTVTGYYEYWTTEVAKLTQDGAELILESSFVGTPATVFVSSTAVVPTITQTAVRNSIATHWRIYRSPKKDRASDKKFPSGFMVAELGSATARQSDGSGGTTTSYAFPTLFNSGTNYYSGYWVTPSNLGADDGAVSTVTKPGNLVQEPAQGCYGFSFGSLSGNVVGIEVEVQGYIASGTAPITLSITIGRGREATHGEYAYFTGPGFGGGQGPRPASKSVVILSTAAGAPTTVAAGGAADPWTPIDQPRLTDTDFDSNFMVVLKPSFLFTSSTVLAMDYVRARVTYGATNAGDSAIQFPTVSYTFGDVTAQVGKNGPPPSSSTADLYEDSLVVNDASNPALIRYSAPGDPESFPETYFLDFETRDNDVVTLVKVVNNRLVVGLRTQVHRVNYLPSERDASFDRGKASETISRAYGVVNPMCACVFSIGRSELLAFVSDHGVHATDGFSFETYTNGLDWSQVISRASTSNAIALVNDRDRQELLFYYRNDALGNESYQCLHLSYAEDHLVDGKPKVSGPVYLRNYHAASGTRAALRSAWSARRSSGAQDVFLGYGGTATAAGAGFVYRETGTTILSQDATLKYATRRMYLAGLSNEWRLGELYGEHTTDEFEATVAYTLNNLRTNDSAGSTVGTKSLNAAGRGLHKVEFTRMCEGLIVTAQVTAETYSQDSIVLDGEDFGVEDAGR